MVFQRLDHVDAAVVNRRARVAIGALFLTNGALFANLLPRYPEIKDDLHLSNAAYGVAIAASAPSGSRRSSTPRRWRRPASHWPRYCSSQAHSTP